MVTEISDWNDLDNVRNDLSGDYVLVNDLDSETDGYAGIGDDFEPIGFVSGNRGGDPFSGELDGNGFQISDLVIEENDSFRGGVAFITQVGNDGLVENLSVDGTVDSAINDVFYGGLAASVGEDGTGTIQNCVSHVDVTIPDGGRVGGLVGNNSGTVTDSYATGSVESDGTVGGLVGNNSGTVTDSYATGSVEANSRVGGLVGRNQEAIADSYATGSVEGNEEVGGLVGFNQDIVTNSYWDTQSTGQDTSDGGGTGLTTAEMQGSDAETNMDTFDFTDVWSTVEAVEVESETIDGQITLDGVATETATVILHNFSEPESVEVQGDGYPILLDLDEDDQLDAQGAFEGQGNIARTETDTDGNYSADIPGTTGDTIAIAVDFDTEDNRYGRLVTTVI